MKVPFLDVKQTYLELKDEIDAAVKAVLSKGQYILGENVERFEAEFAGYCGCNYGIGVASGLDTLELILKAWTKSLLHLSFLGYLPKKRCLSCRPSCCRLNTSLTAPCLQKNQIRKF